MLVGEGREITSGYGGVDDGQGPHPNPRIKCGAGSLPQGEGVSKERVDHAHLSSRR